MSPAEAHLLPPPAVPLLPPIGQTLFRLPARLGQLLSQDLIFLPVMVSFMPLIQLYKLFFYLIIVKYMLKVYQLCLLKEVKLEHLFNFNNVITN